MRYILFLAALVATPVAAQVKISGLPSAANLTGTEKLLATQGSTSVAVTPVQISTFLTSTFQASDADLTAIAALSTTPFGRSLLTMADAPSTRSAIGLTIGTNVEAWDADLDAIAALTGTNTIYYRSGTNAWSPVMFGPNFTFSGGALTIPGLPITLSGDVSGSSTSNSGAITVTLATVPIAKGGTGATTAAAARSGIGAAASGANADITSITGSAATLTTGRTFTLTGDVGCTSASFNGSANLSTACTLASSGATAGTYGSATVIPVPTIDAKGRVTSMTTVALTPYLSLAGGALAGVVTNSSDQQALAIRVTGDTTAGTQTTGGGPGAELAYSGGAGRLLCYNRSTSAFLPCQIYGSVLKLTFGSSPTTLTLDSSFGNYASDSAASSGGVPVNGIYRNGSQLMVRVN